MKKTIFAFSMLALLLTSCATYTGQGAYVGAQFGTILGSAGMAGGAAIGAVIGAAADQREAERYDEYRRERTARRSSRYSTETSSAANDSGFDSTNSGDDRVDFGIAGPTAEQSGTRTATTAVSAQKTVSLDSLTRRSAQRAKRK